MAIGGILYLLDAAWGYGSPELSAPQATLMKMVVEGVMDGNLPWNLVFIGVFTALAAEVLGVPVLPFAVGLYLPIHLSIPMMAGGLVRYAIERKKNISVDKKKETVDGGVLYSSGLIAGEGLVGILLAVLAIIPSKIGGAENVGALLSSFTEGLMSEEAAKLVGIAAFALLVFSLLKFSLWKKQKTEAVDNK